LSALREEKESDPKKIYFKMFLGRKWVGRQGGGFLTAIMGYSESGDFGVDEFRR
jgi:hypothetical protein